jgi:hypothetical protein
VGRRHIRVSTAWSVSGICLNEWCLSWLFCYLNEWCLSWLFCYLNEWCLSWLFCYKAACPPLSWIHIILRSLPVLMTNMRPGTCW